MDTDEDILVYIPLLLGALNKVNLRKKLSEDGWVVGGSFAGPSNSSGNSSPFESYTKGSINLIVTWDKKFHHRFLAATTVCKRLNLLDKADRIVLFQAVLYGNICP